MSARYERPSVTNSDDGGERATTNNGIGQGLSQSTEHIDGKFNLRFIQVHEMFCDLFLLFDTRISHCYFLSIICLDDKVSLLNFNYHTYIHYSKKMDFKI